MARSHCVYAVMMPGQIPPAACFTVKHELRSWIMSKPDNLVDQMTVWRCPDNPWHSSGGTTQMNIDDILNGVRSR